MKKWEAYTNCVNCWTRCLKKCGHVEIHTRQHLHCLTDCLRRMSSHGVCCLSECLKEGASKKHDLKKEMDSLIRGSLETFKPMQLADVKPNSTTSPHVLLPTQNESFGTSFQHPSKQVEMKNVKAKLKHVNCLAKGFKEVSSH